MELNLLSYHKDLFIFISGSQAILTYATVQGYLIGWDLRAPGGIAWRLRNEPKHGKECRPTIHRYTAVHFLVAQPCVKWALLCLYIALLGSVCV